MVVPYDFTIDFTIEMKFKEIQYLLVIVIWYTFLCIIIWIYLIYIYIIYIIYIYIYIISHFK